jgi:hypothetical protein
MIRLSIVFICLLVGCTNWNINTSYNPDRQYFIRDSSNRICIYHGLNVDNRTKNSNNGMADTCAKSSEDFKIMADMGFNLARHLWHWEAIEKQQGIYDTFYIQRKIKRIEWMRQSNIDVVVDLHQDLFAQRYTGNGFPDWAINDVSIPFTPQQPWNKNYLEPAVIMAYDNFWKSDTLQQKYVEVLKYVVDAVDTLPNVIGVDVMNEPFIAIAKNFESRVLTDLYKKCQQVFKGKRVKMFYEPWMGTSTGISSFLRFKPQVDAVYFPHYYDPLCDAGKPYTDGNKFSLSIAMRLKMAEAEKFRVPMLYGEWGYSNRSYNYLEGIDDFLNMCDTYRIGWSYWSFDDVKANDIFGLYDEDGNAMPVLKRLIRIYPQKIAGEDPNWKYAYGKFEMEYFATDTVNTTNVFVPHQAKVEFDGDWIRNGKVMLFRAKSIGKQSIVLKEMY